MTDPERPLLSIGQFARQSRLPVSTLRYYHQQGLLVPAHVDSSTGYRWYDPEQLAEASVVQELRRVGVAPATIIEIVGSFGGDVVELLRRERRRIEAEVRERIRALDVLDRLAAQLTGGRPYVVTTVRRSDQTVVTHAGAIRSEAAISGVQRLLVQLRKQFRGAGSPDPGCYGAAFPLDLEHDPVPATVFAPAELPETTGLSTMTLAACTCAVTEHAGDFALGSAYQAVLDWIADQDLRPTGPVIEEYLGNRHNPRTRISIVLANDRQDSAQRLLQGSARYRT